MTRSTLAHTNLYDKVPAHWQAHVRDDKERDCADPRGGPVGGGARVAVVQGQAGEERVAGVVDQVRQGEDLWVCRKEKKRGTVTGEKVTVQIEDKGVRA